MAWKRTPLAVTECAPGRGHEADGAGIGDRRGWAGSLPRLAVPVGPSAASAHSLGKCDAQGALSCFCWRCRAGSVNSWSRRGCASF
jgi:hypothetical protein